MAQIWICKQQTCFTYWWLVEINCSEWTNNTVCWIPRTGHWSLGSHDHMKRNFSCEESSQSRGQATQEDYPWNGKAEISPQWSKVLEITWCSTGEIGYFIVVFIFKFISNDRCCPVTEWYVTSFPSFMSKGKYENAIEISFIEYYVVLSYWFISIFLFSVISCLI